ncbi:ABC transporter ATP-binding protein [Alteromonas pelagimontana]|uniref:ABC transporter ATP-binding protein n=1 Tax=Alteromonas pelagimontana TaxID=1858656 RepID=A0A6M4MHF5_9ALTE|nr:ABC transporter ATP-binding protein [Alteromonas pelagimontana]QJR82005.1 ABC transporter ATP-binding protein [Alteromonas pelagimontana]
MLHIQHLSRRFPAHTAPILSNLSLQLPAGESASIQGASGCGKSTLLALIAGFDKPDSGDIRVDDTAVHQLSTSGADAFRANHLGVIFQNFNLLECFNVWDNVAFTARLKGNFDPALQRQLLQQLGIDQLANNAVTSLSGGEQQRVAIARALNHRPSLILADEPTGNLDEATSDNVISCLFNECKARQTTLVLVTHSQEVASQADHHYLLTHGALSQMIG